MGFPQPDVTSQTLLGKLRTEPANEAAWQEFVRRYRPGIEAFCLARRIQPADAEDVTQTVLVQLVAKLPQFCYDPSQSFRGWLKVVTRNVLLNYLAQHRRDRTAPEGNVERLLANAEAQEELVREVEAAYDRELLDEAL